MIGLDVEKYFSFYLFPYIEFIKDYSSDNDNSSDTFCGCMCGRLEMNGFSPQCIYVIGHDPYD